MRTTRLILAGALTLSGAGVVAGQPVDPLVAIEDADPIELGRAGARLGDAAVVDRLTAERPAAVRLAAIRATPLLRAPELAVAPLAEIAAGRDPHLAPAAIEALLRIVAGLDGAGLDRRESERGALVPARARLRALAADASARPDLRRAAGRVDHALDALGVPEPRTGARRASKR